VEIDALELTKKLIARRSVLPDDAGCLDMVIEILAPLGFKCEKISVNGVDNLWARCASSTRSFGAASRWIIAWSASRRPSASSAT
jgi:acetylornithine deacetylase/succinyl-diaminopimelate desuccinylase-like protein